MDNAPEGLLARHPAVMTFALGNEVPPLLDSRFPLPLDHPFTTRQAVEVGISPNTLTRLTASGLLRRMLKSVYVAAQLEDSMLLRAQALSLVVPPDTVVTDRTAGWLHGADVLAPNDHLQVPPISMFRLSGNSRLRNELCASGQRALLPEDLMVVHGVPVTTPLRTAWDLGRFLHRDLAIGALDAMLRLGEFTRDELLEGVERFRKQRGVIQLRHLAPLADARSQSPGESTLRLRWLDCGDLPRPTPQVPVADDRGELLFLLDLGVEEIRFAAEYDGERWHSSESDREHDRSRRSWLRQDRAWTIRVFRRGDVYGQHQDAARMLYEGVAEARRALGVVRQGSGVRTRPLGGVRA